MGTKHRIANKTDKNVVVIEVGIGDNISDTDLVKIYNKDNPQASANYVRLDKSPIAKLEPAFKDNLWGGTKIRDVYGKKCDYDVIGESWELSAHPDGQSRIAEGRYKGMLFNEYLNIIGKEALGWKCQAQDRFPILIKFIDAKQALSIQIHPDDEYALENENEYGKNEMWYVVDSEPGSYLYCGLSRDASKEEILERINNNTITDILNKIEVKAGDVVMVKAGTIHAIGAGVSYVRYSRILTVPTVCMIMTEGTSSVIQENFMLRKHLMLLITINISRTIRQRLLLQEMNISQKKDLSSANTLKYISMMSMMKQRLLLMRHPLFLYFSLMAQELLKLMIMKRLWSLKQVTVSL